MKTRTLVILILLVILSAGGYYAYTHITQGLEPLLSQPATVAVRQGDLLVSMSGSGELVAEEIPLTFAISGEISELSVTAGDVVQTGEILARLDDRQAKLDLKTAQLNWEALTSPQIVANQELHLLELQQDLADAQDALEYVRDGPPVWYYEALLGQALADYEKSRKKELAWEAVEAAQADLEWVINYQPDPHDLAVAEAQASLAAVRLAAQEVYVDILQGAPVPVVGETLDWNDELLALEKARLAVDEAQWTLEQMVLSAPSAGTVTQVFFDPGERVDGSPILTLSVLEPILVRFYLEEADLAQVSPGDRLEMRFDSYPDQVFQGSVVRIDPALVPVEGSLLAQIWGEFDNLPEVTLFPGMSLEVDVIAVETSNALLVPLHALRQNPDGSYYVEVLHPNGTFEIAAVTVGLKDLANAQILSGLQVGDKVSTALR